MTATPISRPRPAGTRTGPGHQRFRQAAAMEWVKLRTLRSTWWTLALTFAGAVALAVVVGLNTKNAAGDLTNNALAGVVPGLLFTGVLGVMVMTSEFTSGLIRSTLAAVPRRPLVIAAKAAVFGGVTLVLGEAVSFVAFFAGGAALRHGITAPSLTQPGVLRAVVLSGAAFSLIGLLGMGLGAIIRHTAVAIGVLVGGIWILAQIVGSLAHSIAGYMPIIIIGNSLSGTKPLSCSDQSQCPHPLGPWAGLGMLCLYAAVALAIGGWLLARRDA
jgi:ABC-2 type transport system permease protein